MTFKNSLRVAGLAALATLGFAQSAQAAGNNDLIIGFRTLATGDNDVMVNLGNFASFTSGGPISLGSILSANFGNDWNTRSDLVWGIAGSDNTVGSRDAFLSNSGAAYSSMTAANVSGFNGIFTAVYTGYNSFDNVDGSVSIISDADANSWTVRKGANVFGIPTIRVTNDRFEQTADFDGLITAKETVLTQVTNSGLWTNLGNISFAQNGDLSFAAVPEPSTYGLMGAGALAAAAFVRRRRKLAGAKVAA